MPFVVSGQPSRTIFYISMHFLWVYCTFIICMYIVCFCLSRCLLWRIKLFNIPAAVLRCPSLCCAWAMHKSFSFNQAESYHVTWCLAKTIATRHQGEMWLLQMVTAAGRCSLSHRQKHRNLQRENLQLSQTFCPRIARIWTRLTCHLGCSSADGLPSSKFLLSWQNEESDSQKYDRNYRMAQSFPIHHLSPFYLRLMLFARWRHYFPKLIQINYGMMFRIKRPWFKPNLVKICSIFLKL